MDLGEGYGGEEDLMDEDDMVVKEVGVYLSQQLVDNLFLFQYPSRRHPFTIPSTTKFKPNGQRFEYVVPLQTNSKHYSKDRGEQLGVGLTEEALPTAFDREKRPTESKLMDRITVQSTLVPTVCNFFVGSVQDGILFSEEFHISPLTSVVQMRPALKYKDKIAEKEKAVNQRILNEGNDKKRDEEARAIQRRVIQSDDKDSLRRIHQGQQENAYENEDWVSLNFFPGHSIESRDQFDKLFSSGDELQHKWSKDQYLDAISTIEKEIPKDTYAIFPFYFSQLLPRLNADVIETTRGTIAAKLKAVFLKAQALQYSQIKEFVEASDPELLAELENLCVLLRGIWIIRSEFLYSEQVADARRIIIHLFSKSTSGIINRKDFNEIAMLPHIMATNLIAELAYYVEGQGWKLKTDEDLAFCRKYPDMVARHLVIIENEAELATSDIREEPREKLELAPPLLLPKPAPPQPVSKPSTSTTAPSPKKMILSLGPESVTKQVETLIRTALHDHGVASGDYLLKSVLSAFVKSGLGDKQLSPDLINSRIEDCCTSLHGVYVLKKLNSSVDEFRTPIIQLFATKASVKKSDVTAACQAAVGKNPPSHVYQKIMKELAVSSGAVWDGRLPVNLPSISVVKIIRGDHVVVCPTCFLVEGDLVEMALGDRAPCRVSLENSSGQSFIMEKGEMLRAKQFGPKGMILDDGWNGFKFRALETPLTAMLKSVLDCKRPETIISTQLRELFRWLTTWIIWIFLAIGVLINTIRLIFLEPSGRQRADVWIELLFNYQFYALLPILPLTLPVLCLIARSYGNAQIVCLFDELQSSKQEFKDEEDIDEFDAAPPPTKDVAANLGLQISRSPD
ncbi:hypothetical protein HDU97_002552 [Phlyctochytrium planicorne]|nr:hypothetical protein HDU97_002552 [Phlyctochytrium planicorne]